MGDYSIKLSIVGGGGFVGTHLARQIGEKYQDISAHTLNRSTFDLTLPDTWRSMPEETDTVVHAAARSSGQLYDIFNTNVLNAQNFAGFLNARGVHTLVYLSTGGIYGNPSGPASPKSPVAPDGSYAVSKFLAERKLREAFKGRYHVLRLFFPYGPGQKLPRLVPRIIKLIKEGQNIRCNSDGGPWLSLTHVEDVCKAIVDHVLREDGAPEIVNIAPDKPVSLQFLAEAIGTVVGKRPVFDFSGQAPDCTSAPWPKMEWKDLDVESVLRPRKRLGWPSL